MIRNIKFILITFLLITFTFSCSPENENSLLLGERPMIENHLDQKKINEYELEEIIEHGKFLFEVSEFSKSIIKKTISFRESTINKVNINVMS